MLKERKIPLWDISGARVQGDHVKISIKNNGRNHIMLQRIIAIALDTKGQKLYRKKMNDWYVLKGITMNLSLKVDAVVCEKNPILFIKAEAEYAFRETALKLSTRECARQADK